MVHHLTAHREGFADGFTSITRLDETEDNTGIALGVLKLRGGENYHETAERETAWLLMNGKATIHLDGRAVNLERRSLFDESASCIHLAAGGVVRIEAVTDCEFTVFATANTKRFKSALYLPEDVPNEHRGAGQVGGACLRFVRTIFDGTISPENADLVLGEVITLPGRWSSYPPHHHPQPEIYHYRFTEPQGYGHAELGETVLKVRQYDSVKIFHPADHAQCAAPGYGMYYAWVIRHLPGNRYTVPEFTEDHRWTMGDDAPFWRPVELAADG